jgi:hypothetical protein
MMKFLRVVLMGVLLWGVASPAAADFVGQNDGQVQAVANPILDTVRKDL